MDRADRIGFWVSGVVHAGAVVLALVGGALFRPQPLEAVRMTEVSTMSETEFQALASAAEGRAPLADRAATTPAQPHSPDSEDSAGAPEAQGPPATDARAAALDSPARPEARPDVSDLTDRPAPIDVATLAPQPAPPTRAEAPASLPAAAQPPTPDRSPAEARSPAPIPQRSPDAPILTPRPRGRPDGLAEAAAARAAAEAQRQREALLAREADEAEAAAEAAARAADARAARRAAAERAAEERREAAARADEAEAAARAEAARERARREAAAEKEAAQKEAAEKAEKAAAEKAEKAAAEKAEKAAAEKAAKQAAEAAAAAKAREKAAAERKAAEAAAERKAEAAAASKAEGAGGQGGGGAAASGPPLSQGEKDGFRVAVEACWNIGSLSSEASRTRVSVRFSMTPDGRVEANSLKMIDHSGGSDAAARQAYEAARRAVLRCQKDGYPLPAEKYNRWKTTIIDFNPAGGARIK